MTTMRALTELLPSEFVAHPFHTGPRAFAETNCYVDLWLAMLHALGLEAEACLGVGFGTDFEGDQWTFVKPSHGDLERLFGIGVEELALWRSLFEHVQVQVARGRIPLVEMDAFFLPDTHGTDYRSAHVKTTVGITYVDRTARRMRYFHNAGYFELSGDDFDGVFRFDRETPDDYLPPYCELVKTDRALKCGAKQLHDIARELSAHHFHKRPHTNPIAAYGVHMTEHMQWIVAGDDAAFHRYSFAALRQLGSSFETLAAHLRWLNEEGGSYLLASADAFDRIAPIAKRLILKLARVANSKRPADLSEAFSEMASAWEDGMEKARLGLSR